MQDPSGKIPIIIPILIGLALVLGLPNDDQGFNEVGQQFLFAAGAELLTVGVCPASAVRGRAVIGHTKDLDRVASTLRARRMDFPQATWDALTAEEQWIVNEQWLDSLIASGDDILLGTSPELALPGSFFGRELDYLISKGFTFSADGTAMVPPMP